MMIWLQTRSIKVARSLIFFLKGCDLATNTNGLQSHLGTQRKSVWIPNLVMIHGSVLIRLWARFVKLGRSSSFVLTGIRIGAFGALVVGTVRDGVSVATPGQGFP